METTQLNSNTLLEGVKISERWFNNLNTATMDIYNKQLNLVIGYYTDFLNSSLGSIHSSNKTKNPFNLFFNTDATKAFWFPFNNDGNVFSSPVINSFDKTYKEVLDYNRNLLTTLNNEFKSNIVQWNKINQQYGEYIEKQMEISKKIANSIAEAYNKHGDFSTASYREAIEKLNHQIDLFMQQSQTLFSNVLKAQQNGFNSEVKKEKESAVKDIKKNDVVLA